MGIIKKLPDDVVNLIAAGEIIAKPSNAIKELIENSMDANATEINIKISDGGLGLLQIQDNGCGIHKDDLNIVAERFTTSKLQSTEDLKRMQTYGFRGEALASISCISDLNITSRVPSSNMAYSADFVLGKLDGTIKVAAGKVGTIVTARNLFKNLKVRKKSFKNSTEERNRISDTIARYAIENPHISFSFKSDLNKISFRTSGNNSIKDCVSSLLGGDIGNCLVERSFSDERLQFECKFVFTKPKAAHTSTYIKDKVENKRIFHVFINKRLVECNSLQNAINNTFSLCDKICNFISVSLKINPERVDVNVHPSKKNVIFLNSEQIIQKLCDYLKDYCCNEASATIELKDNTQNLSLDFDVLGYEKLKIHNTPVSQRVTKGLQNDTIECNNKEMENLNLTHSSICDNSSSKDNNEISIISSTSKTEELNSSTEPIAKKSKIMRDSDQPLILDFVSGGDKYKNAQLDVETFESSQNEFSTKKVYDYYKDRTNTVDRKISEFFYKDNKDDFRRHCISQDVTLVSIDNPAGVIELKEKYDSLQISLVREFDLKSLKSLIDEVFKSVDDELKEIFHCFTFVGFPNDLDYLLIQHNTCLFRLNFVDIFGEIFYQLFLFSFGNFSIYRFEAESDDDLPYLDDLLRCYFILNNGDIEGESVISDVKKGIEFLVKQKDMLWDYFGILIETKNSKPYLSAIPLLLKNYVPHYEALPSLIYNLIGGVDYNNESRCIQQICCILSNFYIPKTKFCAKVEVEKNIYCLNKTVEQWQEIVREILIPLIPKFHPSENLRRNMAVYKVTNCRELYKIFERC
ncbi:Mlh1 [Strongyloides ratti]|uniref:Mlh1 n=1 Tax=Strongyloides ratti TaxID=34506 RepID=A0A090LBX7_STRRB|nr:Mlh1 [Strongyloides ratti]CEF65628.1 Mlh1 [Strongyloides ratti]